MLLKSIPKAITLLEAIREGMVEGELPTFFGNDSKLMHDLCPMSLYQDLTHNQVSAPKDCWVEQAEAPRSHSEREAVCVRCWNREVGVKED